MVATVASFRCFVGAWIKNDRRWAGKTAIWGSDREMRGCEYRGMVKTHPCVYACVHMCVWSSLHTYRECVETNTRGHEMTRVQNKCTSVFNMRVTIFHFFFFLFRYGGILLLLLLLLLFDVSSVTKGDGRMYQGVRKTYRHAATQRLSGKLRLLPVVFALFVMGRTWRR